MTFPQEIFPNLPPNTIIPENEDLYIPYFNQLYEDIAYAVNYKDNNFYSMAITNTAQNIVNVPNFGAFIICISGSASGLPTTTASLNKPDAGIAGNIIVLDAQNGTSGGFAGAAITISSTATNFQVLQMGGAATTGNFNIRLIGTQ